MEVVATGLSDINKYFHIYFGDTSAINFLQTQLWISLTNYDSSYSTNTWTRTELGSLANGYIAEPTLGKGSIY